MRGARTIARAWMAGRWCHLAAVQISTVEYLVTCIGLHVQNAIVVPLTVTFTLASVVLRFYFWALMSCSNNFFYVEHPCQRQQHTMDSKVQQKSTWQRKEGDREMRQGQRDILSRMPRPSSRNKAPKSETAQTVRIV